MVYLQLLQQTSSNHSQCHHGGPLVLNLCHNNLTKSPKHEAKKLNSSYSKKIESKKVTPQAKLTMKLLWSLFSVFLLNFSVSVLTQSSHVGGCYIAACPLASYFRRVNGKLYYLLHFQTIENGKF